MNSIAFEPCNFLLDFPWERGEKIAKVVELKKFWRAYPHCNLFLAGYLKQLAFCDRHSVLKSASLQVHAIMLMHQPTSVFS